MSKLFTTVLFLILVFQLNGAPLKNIPQKVTQPDGTILECYASGDEYYNWLHDENGYTIIQNKQTGWYVYADLQNEELIPTRYIPGEDDPEETGLTPEINISVERVLDKRRAFEAESPKDMGQAPRTGLFNNIVIFIRFSDQEEYSDPISLYDDMFNDVSSSANSMYNYFKEASYNQLEITTTFYPEPSNGFIVSYQDSQPRDYYVPYSATNTIGYQTDDESRSREHKLLKRAVEAVAGQIPSNLNVDGDGDGDVDNVCFIIQGETTAWSTLLWPHRWALYSEDAYINNKRVYDYNFQLDARIYNGVLAHEMFHSLGAPDLYHYSYDGLDPAGAWDLMGANQHVPQHMGAYMKYRYGGWINSIPEITESGTYELNQLVSSTNNVFKIASANSANEYFLVEYRKKEGAFESSLPGEGLLVYRINPTVRGNADGPPDEVYIYRPHGTVTENGSLSMAGFSGNSGRTSINDFTNPSSFLSDGSAGGLSIKNVGVIGNTINFEVQMSCGLNLTGPNGGEELKEDEPVEITWYSNDSSKVNLELHNSSGFYLEIASGEVNNGSYTWTPAGVDYADDYRIKIVNVSDTACFDLSDETFSIVENLGIPNLIAPANNSIDQSLTPILEWDALPKAEQYRVEVAANTLFLASVIDDTVNTNQFEIPAGTLIGEKKYYWRVRAEKENVIGEWSDKFNFITHEEKWIFVKFQKSDWTNGAGDSVEIDWNDNLDENVMIDLFKGGKESEGGEIIETITPSTESDGYFTWHIPDDILPAEDYLIRIQSVNDPAIFHYSEFFTILEKLNIPVIISQSESMTINEQDKISFKINVDCEDSLEYQWRMRPPSFSFDIDVEDLHPYVSGAKTSELFLNDLSRSDDSIYYYCVITNKEQYPLRYQTRIHSEKIFLHIKYIEVTSPGDGSMFTAGKIFNIEWEDNIDEAVRIDLKIGGNPGAPDGEHMLTIADSTESDGVYEWLVPSDLPAMPDYKIRISSKLDPNLEDYSMHSILTDVKDESNEIPESFYLSECYPNPFNPSTTIEFGLPEESNVSLEVYNIAGQKVADLLQNDRKSAGRYKVKFSAGSLSSGIYFYKITTGKNIAVKKMMLLK